MVDEDGCCEAPHRACPARAARQPRTRGKDEAEDDPGHRDVGQQRGRDPPRRLGGWPSRAVGRDLVDDIGARDAPGDEDEQAGDDQRRAGAPPSARARLRATAAPATSKITNSARLPQRTSRSSLTAFCTVSNVSLRRIRTRPLSPVWPRVTPMRSARTPSSGRRSRMMPRDVQHAAVVVDDRQQLGVRAAVGLVPDLAERPRGDHALGGAVGQLADARRQRPGQRRQPRRQPLAQLCGHLRAVDQLVGEGRRPSRPGSPGRAARVPLVLTHSSVSSSWRSARPRAPRRRRPGRARLSSTRDSTARASRAPG